MIKTRDDINIMLPMTEQLLCEREPGNPRATGIDPSNQTVVSGIEQSPSRLSSD